MSRRACTSALCLLGACTALAGPSDAPRSAPSAPAAGQSWSGTATNFDVHASDSVHLHVSEVGSGRVAVTGGHGAQELFGQFRAEGTLRPCVVDPGMCLRVVGAIRFGDDGSGFPSGTEGTYTLELVASGGTARGAYHIGPLPGVPEVQLGLVELHRDPGPPAKAP